MYPNCRSHSPSPEREAFWCANESFALVNAANDGILSSKKDRLLRKRTASLFILI